MTSLSLCERPWGPIEYPGPAPGFLNAAEASAWLKTSADDVSPAPQRHNACAHPAHPDQWRRPVLSGR